MEDQLEQSMPGQEPHSEPVRDRWIRRIDGALLVLAGLVGIVVFAQAQYLAGAVPLTGPDMFEAVAGSEGSPGLFSGEWPEMLLPVIPLAGVVLAVCSVVIGGFKVADRDMDLSLVLRILAGLLAATAIWGDFAFEEAANGFFAQFYPRPTDGFYWALGVDFFIIGAGMLAVPLSWMLTGKGEVTT